ncbi:MAG: PIN domain-containing protein, partial [Ilumatobacter sp.]|nr:PIN domain-containing protein [Ilumatobacter sp.]
MTDLLATVDTATSERRAVESVQRTRLVLDTSVLIADPTCVLEFTNADVVVPLTVVEELDGLKSRSDDVGRAARTALRTLEELRMNHGGSLAQPVPTGAEGATLQIEINNIRKHLLIEHGLNPDVADNRIIGAAIGQSDFGPTTMVSNDAALRIKAAHLGVKAAEHTRARRVDDRPAIGWATLDTTHEAIDSLYAAGGIAIDAVHTTNQADDQAAATVTENEFAVLRSGSQSALVRAVNGEFVLLPQS